MLFLVVAAVVTLGASPSAARKHSAHKAVSSSATLDAVSADGLSGNVSSPRGACLGGRTVTVYMVNSDRSLPSSVPYGTAVTRGDGSWALGGWAYPGEYYAVVEAKKTRKLLCDAATSNARTWWTSSSGSSG